MKKILFLLAGVLIGLTLTYVFAWTDPTTGPPSGQGFLYGDGSGNIVVATGSLRLANPSNLFVEQGTASFNSASAPATNQKVYINGNLQMGTAASQKGITFYDTVGGSAYCMKVTSGALAITAGACP